MCREVDGNSLESEKLGRKLACFALRMVGQREIEKNSGGEELEEQQRIEELCIVFRFVERRRIVSANYMM